MQSIIDKVIHPILVNIRTWLIHTIGHTRFCHMFYYTIYELLLSNLQLQTAQSFYNSIHELIATLKKSGDPLDLSSLKPSLELIASISTNAGTLFAIRYILITQILWYTLSVIGERTRITWENLLTYLKSVCHIMERFVNFLKVIICEN